MRFVWIVTIDFYRRIAKRELEEMVERGSGKAKKGCGRTLLHCEKGDWFVLKMIKWLTPNTE